MLRERERMMTRYSGTEKKIGFPPPHTHTSVKNLKITMSAKGSGGDDVFLK